MAKVLMGSQPWIYPQPTLLIGSVVNGKPTFMAEAWSGIANAEPPMISVAIRHHRYTLRGIRQNMVFSVNIPSTDLVKETDYCGITTGEKVDKVEACRFKVFYGELNNAPLIEQCPVNLECRVAHLLDLGTHALVVGKIEQTHVTESCLTDGKPDIEKIKPFTFIPTPVAQYYAMGNAIAKVFIIGKELKPK